jgi:hypothetical protein
MNADLIVEGRIFRQGYFDIQQLGATATNVLAHFEEIALGSPGAGMC